MNKLSILALTLPGRIDPSIAIAAARAGAVGVLNLEMSHDKEEAVAAVKVFEQYATSGGGIKFSLEIPTLLEALAEDLPPCMQLVILTSGPEAELAHWVQSFKERGLTVLLETSSLEGARLGQRLGVDGVIAKGHEAGGHVGEKTTFVLLQQILAHVDIPVWAQGGIGLHTAAACFQAGAAGVVLDVQLALVRESHLPEEVKVVFGRMNGVESFCVPDRDGGLYRFIARPGSGLAEKICLVLAQPAESRASGLKKYIAWDMAPEHIWPVGQESSFATPLATVYQTVGGVLEAFRQAVNDHLRIAEKVRPLAENSGVALAHGTRYPIVQGPMTRVSDRAEFAAAVAEGGALPFLALALMNASEISALMQETRAALGDRPWGVGILGFVPPELRSEQIEVVLKQRPAYALIAGGRPDQALALERAGIPTYLHVPSPELLDMFLADGARRFIFEGCESGGHIGPRSSFVLWNSIIDRLMELSAEILAECQVLFAGGIHDARSAAMVAAMAAPLAKNGCKLGVLMGTAYLFTEEVVSSGAILQGFQEEALRCTGTTVLESGHGHNTRCAPTPFAEVFALEKRRLLEQRFSHDEIKANLETLNIGRLRIASKGITHHPDFGKNPQAPKYIPVSSDDQHREGMYMIGQAAALRVATTNIARLHEEVSVQSTERLIQSAQMGVARNTAKLEHQVDVALIGMACLLPKSPDIQTFWENILNRVDAIEEIPKERWDWKKYFDSNPDARDKIYSKWGGFLDDVAFDPLRYGMPPNSLASIEPLHLLTLETARAALEDAGYLTRPFNRDRASVILGASGGLADLGNGYAVRAALPELMQEVPAELLAKLPEWSEDSFPGILLNVAAGRVANRFDLNGVNFTIDAACASSLAAVYQAVRELSAGTSDLVLAGGADTVQGPFAYLCFSKTHALSSSGRCRTFDEQADGIAISEGIAILVLKRLSDAERDGDRIYAVIKGAAGSSDGRDKGLTAPRPAGQVLALERAYTQAGVSPATVELIEAHGTGTSAGDLAEVEALKQVFSVAGVERQSVALGSVKSMIGHTKSTAGMAGMVKAALALHKRVLPPTLNVTQPNSKADFPNSPFYINSLSRPWLERPDGSPRRAGVSAFGFGGTNFHVVLEEYRGDFLGKADQAAVKHWPSELFVWSGESRLEIMTGAATISSALEQGAEPALLDLAWSLWHTVKPASRCHLAIIATSLADLRQKLALALPALQSDGSGLLSDRQGLYYSESPLALGGKIAFLFPGQGSQYPGMLSELAIHFSEVRQAFERADRALVKRFPQRLSSYIFPAPAFKPEEEKAQSTALMQTNVAQAALGAAGTALQHLLAGFCVRADMAAGHSYGEYLALYSAGVISEETLFSLSEARGRCILETAKGDLGTMAAVSSGADAVSQALEGMQDVWIANMNSPKQTVISGTRAGITRAVERLDQSGLSARAISVSCAFHSPIIAPARDRFSQILGEVHMRRADFPVYSNTNALPYPSDPADAAGLLAEHLVKPVRFDQEIRAMYADGARIFLEVGPRGVLTSLVDQILGDEAHLALAVDGSGRDGLTHMLHTLGELTANGVGVNLDRLFSGREAKTLDLTRLVEQTSKKPVASSIWWVNGGGARRAYGPTGNVDRKSEPPTSPSSLDPPPAVSLPFAQPRSPVAQVAALKPNQEIPFAPAAIEGASAQSDPTRVMLQFQQLMGSFIETQQQVMHSYLNASRAGVSLASDLSVGNAEKTNMQGPSPLLVDQTPVAAANQNGSDASVTALSGLLETVQETSAAAPPVDADAILKVLTDIFSEHTGYPAEIVAPDANVESDLGCDSIKLTEILGILVRKLRPADSTHRSKTVGLLSKLRTLRGIAREYSLVLNGSGHDAACDAPALKPEPAGGGPVLAPQSIPGPRIELLPRMIPGLVPAPLPIAPAWLDVQGIFVITDDDHGTAQALSEELSNIGVRSVRLRMDGNLESFQAGVYTANLADPMQARAAVSLIRSEYGQIAGLIHLLPLKQSKPFEHIDLAYWQKQVEMETVSLFNLAQSAAQDLMQVSAGKRWLFVVTSGAWDSGIGVQYPSQGAAAGVVKTLAQEWPQVNCRVIDFEPDSSSHFIAAQLLAELAADQSTIEIVYSADNRTKVQVYAAALTKDRPPRMELNSESVIFVTGGARGITAEIALELARESHCRFVIAGKSVQPEPEESPQTSGLEGAALKAVLLEDLRRGDHKVVPIVLEAAFQAILHERERRQYLKALQQSAAYVEYCQVDVRDGRQFEFLLESIYQRYGKIDGVIHGAGVIEDKYLLDKSIDSFRRVLETKALSAFVLAKALRPESLKFLAFFSSVAGRFGNPGQADYAAANEVLSRLAARLDRNWPGFVLAFDWGPWRKAGMVSPEMERQFLERGIHLIEPEAGRRAFLDELQFGRKGQSEVVFGEGFLEAWGSRFTDPAWLQEPSHEEIGR